MKNSKAYHRQKEIVEELKELKEFIEQNAEEPLNIIKKLKRSVYGFDPNKTTAFHS